MRIRLGLCLATALLQACGTQQGRGNDGGDQEPALLRDTCTTNSDLAPRRAALLDDAQTPELDALTRRLNAGLPDGLTARLVASEGSVGARHYDFQYQSDRGIPLCEHVVRAHRIGDQTLIDGELANATLPSVVDLSGLVWADAESSAKAAARSIGLPDVALRLGKSEHCFLLGASGAEASWDLQFHVAGKPYTALGNGERVTQIEAKTFNATGSARVFDTGPSDGKLIDVKLKDMTSGDGLASVRFLSVVDGGVAAVEPSRVFAYEPSDPRFAEVSAFAHVEQMADWLMLPSHHYQMDCVPIGVHTHVVFELFGGDTTVNNAEYVAAEQSLTGFPVINVGDGDGAGLMNIALDFDTVAHELGHHVINRKLKSRRGSSLVLHEALADYLVFAKTGNACLGESICPAGSPMCTVPTQCLRSGLNTLNFQDEDLPSEEHERSQLISGMLWDLGMEEGVGQSTVASLVIKGVDYLLPSSGYADLIKALMAADLELFDGVHACRVKQHALARGFGDLIAGVDCASYEKTRL